ncbi:hypothetical protein BZA77DRAFT_322303 [Pyronema omphalodes]|nr:hypothetical protein BZA77DRAFT_322303 [Pyronema omphalodes]
MPILHSQAPILHHHTPHRSSRHHHHEHSSRRSYSVSPPPSRSYGDPSTPRSSHNSLILPKSPHRTSSPAKSILKNGGSSSSSYSTGNTTIIPHSSSSHTRESPEYRSVSEGRPKYHHQHSFGNDTTAGTVEGPTARVRRGSRGYAAPSPEELREVRDLHSRNRDRDREMVLSYGRRSGELKLEREGKYHAAYARDLGFGKELVPVTTSLHVPQPSTVGSTSSRRSRRRSGSGYYF